MDLVRGGLGLRHPYGPRTPSRKLAASRDAAGEQYAVVLRERGRPQPIAVLNIAGAYGCLGVRAYVARLQPLARPVGERPIGG
ncbi:hypothetical protein AB0N62_08570 [Streptomyces sp. NPDC093982]|uniref:hypothetical protein n=1 Tax=Streptomyces sp. NPDC093982 TaxID=3155077 RepID=UPI00343F8BE6